MGKGGGGKHHGKSAGKMLISLGMAVWGAVNPAVFGLAKTAVWRGALYGLSLGTTIGNAFFNKPSAYSGQDASSFDSKMNTVDSNARIPLVYGEQKIGGLQSYHKTSVKNKTLWKHVIACEGEIEDAYGITANGYLIPSTVDGRHGRDYNPVVFKLVNHKDRAATVYIGKKQINTHGNNGLDSFLAWVIQHDIHYGKVLSLYANGHTHDIPLLSEDDLNKSGAQDGSCSLSTIYQTILGAMDSQQIVEDGWELIEPVITSDFPSDLQNLSVTNAYENPVSIRLQNHQCGDSVLDFYRGVTNQNVPSNYLETGGYPKMAYMNATLKYTEKLGGGNPVLTAIVKGRKILDLRDNQIKYSKNPALCLYDYMTNDVYGAGEYITPDMIDKDSFIDVANYCDQTVTYIGTDGVQHSEPRYQLDMTISETKSHLEIMQDILKTFCGFIVFSRDKISLRCERKQSAIYHFDDDNIVEKSVSVKANSLDQSPNRIVTSYIEPAMDYTAVKVIVDDTVNQQPRPYGRGQVIEQEITLGGITRQTQALRVSKIYRDIIRLCPITVSFSTGTMASHLEPGDVITISKKFINDKGLQQDLLTNIPLRIQEIKEDKGVFEITARLYNPSIYDDSLGASLQVFPYVDFKGGAIKLVPDMSQPVKNLRAVARKTSPYYQTSAGAYTIDVQWDIPDDPNYAGAQIWYKRMDTTPADVINVPAVGVTPYDLGYYGGWQYAGQDYNHIVIPSAWYRDTYIIKAVPVDVEGKAHDDYSTTITYKVTRRTAVPDTPTGFKIEFGSDITASWNAVLNTDVDFYELRYDGKRGNEDGLIAKISATQAKISLRKRSDTVYLYACNTTGRYGNPASFSFNRPAPPKPNAPTVKSIFGAFTVSMDKIPPSCSHINVYIDDVADKAIGSSYQYSGNPGVYVVKYAFVDAFGEGQMSDWVHGIIKNVIDPAWITDGSVTADKLNSSINKAIADNTSDIASNLAAIKQQANELNDTNNELRNTNADISNIVTKLNSTQPATSYPAIAEAYRHGADAQSEITRVIGVLNNPTAQDQFTSITQANDRITSVVAALNGNASTSQYTSIKQTADGLSALSKTVSTVDGKTSTNASQIAQNANSISTIVSNLNTTDASTSKYTSIKQTADKLSSLATTVSGQGNTLTTHSSQISQNANSISTIVSNLNATDATKSQYTSIKQTADKLTSLATTVSGQGSTLATHTSQISQNASSINSVVSKLNITDPSKSEFSSIKQASDSINSIVTALNTTNPSASQYSSIRQTANSVNTIVQNLQKSPAASGYSALTQLNDAIGLKVAKGDVINQINLSPTGTTIDGKYLHVTGDSVFDKGVVARNIEAGSITADKLQVTTLSAVCARIGNLRTKDSGARVEISDNLICVYDENNVLRVRMGVWN